MILFLLCMLLSLCYVPIYQDQYINENNIIENVDSAPVKNYGYIDEEGIQAMFFMSDFTSDDFIVSFIRGCAGSYGSPWYEPISYNSSTLGMLDFNNLSNGFYGSAYGQMTRPRLVNVSRIILQKEAFASFDTCYEVQYSLRFYNGNTTLLNIHYWIVVPFTDDFEHDFGVLCSRYQINTQASVLGDFPLYYENTNSNSVTPLINYFIRFKQSINTPSSNSGDYNTGYQVGYKEGKSNGYQEGYQAGLTDNPTDPQMFTIFTGILNIGLLPVNVFLTILNFEVFGINIAGFVSSLLTIAIVIIILRFVFGGKKND